MANYRRTPIDQFVIATVKKKREEKGMSQNDLAIELNVSAGFIGDIESTKRITKYSLNQINELAKIFECSPQDFIPKKPL